VANAGVADSLVLRGTQAGTLTGLGQQFAGFTRISELQGVTWNFTGTNVLGAGTSLTIAGSATLAGTWTDAGGVTIKSGGSLVDAATGTAILGNVALKGGQISSAAGAQLVIGPAGADAQDALVSASGSISVTAGGKVSGFGTIGASAAGALIDNGLITAQGGTLSLDTTVSGTGHIAIAAASVLLANAAVATGIAFKTGSGETLDIAKGATLTGAISHFGAGDTVDFLKIAPGSLTFIGHTLTLETGMGQSASLTLAGNYTAANFHLSSDGHGGSDITFVPAAEFAAREGGSVSEYAPGSLGHDPVHSSTAFVSGMHGHFHC